MNKVKVVACFKAFLVIFILYDILALSTYNNDWDAYEMIYNGVISEDDIFFQYLVDVANSLDLSFQHFFTLIQTFTFIAILFFYCNIIHNGLIALLLALLTILAPNLSILLRYYLAFSFFLCSLAFYLRGRKKIAFSFLVVAFFTHSGIVVCYPILFMSYWIKKQELSTIYKKMFLYAIVLLPFKIVIVNFLSSIGIGVFSSYKDQIASISSTIYVDLEYFMWYGYVYYLHSKVVVKNPSCLNDKTYRLLYACLLYPILFLFVSNIMIVQIRIYEPFIVFAVTYIYYVAYKYRMPKFEICSIVLMLLLMSIVMKYYLLGLFTGGISEWVRHYAEIIESNKESILLNFYK